MGLRGAVSILLAILPVIGGLPDGSTCFIVVLASLSIRGRTIGLAARALRLLAQPGSGLADRVALEPPGNAEVELAGRRIHPESSAGQGGRGRC